MLKGSAAKCKAFCGRSPFKTVFASRKQFFGFARPKPRFFVTSFRNERFKTRPVLTTLPEKPYFFLRVTIKRPQAANEASTAPPTTRESPVSAISGACVWAVGVVSVPSAVICACVSLCVSVGSCVTAGCVGSSGATIDPSVEGAVVKG